MAKSSKAKHVCFKTLYISQPSHGRNHQKPQRTHREYKMFTFRNSQRCKLIIFRLPNYSSHYENLYYVNGSSRNLTPRDTTRNTTHDAFMNKYMCSIINLSSFSRHELGLPILKLPSCKRNKNLKKSHLSTPGFYFSTMVRRVTSPTYTWGPPAPRHQALIRPSCANFLAFL